MKKFWTMHLSLGLKMDFFKMVKLPERVLFLRLIMKV